MVVNPYDPQNPTKPEYFGGRKQVLDKVQERIQKAKIEGQSGGILIQGYRGVGKTSLLAKIKSIENPDPDQPINNSLVIYRRLSKTTSEDELYQIIIEEISEEVRRRKNTIQKIAEQVRSVKLMDIQLDLGAEKDRISPFLRWQRLTHSIRNAELILVEIDDADYLSIEAIGALKTIVETRSKTPVLLVVSGGPDFEERLVNDYSPVARIFSGASFNIGEFSIEETQEVLEKPLKTDNRAHWKKDGISAVHRLSRGYPYLVQCIASASFIEGTEMDEARVVSSKDKALEIGKIWLSQELKDASDLDIISFAKIAESGKTTLKSSEIGLLGVSPPYVGRLVIIHVLKKVNRGRYSVNKSPLIAHYHMLKRDLKIRETE